jgi:hypothetical protein
MYTKQQGSSTESVHYHAGFRVYIDNNLQDYSDWKYMNFVPCDEHDSKKSQAEEQIEKAHLHDGVGDVVHVHRSGSTWQDLFTNIKVAFPTNKPLVGYIDGVEVSTILSEQIAAYTTAIFVVGESSVSHSEERVEKSYIEQLEAKSELCGS